MSMKDATDRAKTICPRSFDSGHKYIGTSIKEGCATLSLYASSGPKPKGVPTYDQRGRG